MKHLIYFVITIFIIGCGGSSDSSTTVEKSNDIVVKAGERQICTSETSFTVTPTNDPLVTFETDAVTNDTTIIVDENSSGYVTIKDCTTR